MPNEENFDIGLASAFTNNFETLPSTSHARRKVSDDFDEDNYSSDNANGDSLADGNSENESCSNHLLSRRERDKLRARERRKHEPEALRKVRREKCRVAQARRRVTETPEQREHRLLVDRERARRRRQKETDTQKQFRLEMNRIRTAIRRRGTVDSAMDAIQIFKEDPEVKQLLENPENRVVQLENPNEPMRITIGVVNEAQPTIYYKLASFRRETEDQKQLRLQKGRNYAAKRRSQETAEQRAKRLERERLSTRRRRQKGETNSRSETQSRSVSSVRDENDPEGGEEDYFSTSEPSSSIHNVSVPVSGDDVNFGSEFKLIETPQPVVMSIPTPQPEVSMSQMPLPEVSEPVPTPSTSSLPLLEDSMLTTPGITSTAPINLDSTDYSQFASINGYLLGTTQTLAMGRFALDLCNVMPVAPTLSTAEPTNMWGTTNKDKNDMYFMQNLGLGMTDTTVNQPLFGANTHQPTPFFQTASTSIQPSNPIDVDPSSSNFSSFLLRNFSSNQTLDFSTPGFVPQSMLGAIGASPNPGNVFNPSIDSLLGTYAHQPSVASASTPFLLNSAIESPRTPVVDVESDGDTSLRFFTPTPIPITTTVLSTPRPLGAPTPSTSAPIQFLKRIPLPSRLEKRNDAVVRNSFQSLELVLEATADELQEAECVRLDHQKSGLLTPCPDLSLMPNAGLHLVLSPYMLETDWQRLRNVYYTSLHRLLRARNVLDESRLYGYSGEDDQGAWSEVYDTLRTLHLEVSRVLFEKMKTDIVDTALFNSVERAEFAMKRIQRPGFGRELTFLDLVLVEMLDLLDHMAQVMWMVFPNLAQHRAEVHAHHGFKALRFDLN
uniref:BZIP domain-containing protein n=1 Tax=Panagrellus redivivus TaxID=6233 RepID=A0A7E4VN93_PANRE